MVLGDRLVLQEGKPVLHAFIWGNLSFKNLYKAVRVVQWLERRRKDLVILASPVRILLWDVGVGLSEETV
jgi:hypothetical protein